MTEKQPPVPASSMTRDRGLKEVPVTCHEATRPTLERKRTTSELKLEVSPSLKA